MEKRNKIIEINFVGIEKTIQNRKLTNIMNVCSVIFRHMTTYNCRILPTMQYELMKKPQLLQALSTSDMFETTFLVYMVTGMLILHQRTTI